MKVEVYLVQHTHWDREWYLTYRQFRTKLVKLLKDVLERITTEPHFKFYLDGQVAPIEDTLAVRPAYRNSIERAVRAGRLHFGPWYTLADEFIPSGETLIRNLELGIRKANEYGIKEFIGYLPDQFGHIAQMPQILVNFGIQIAALWRGVPDNGLGLTFTWKSPSGHSVRCAHMRFGYANGARLDLSSPENFALSLKKEVHSISRIDARQPYLIMCGDDHMFAQKIPESFLHFAQSQTEISPKLSTIHQYIANMPSPVGEVIGELRYSDTSYVLRGSFTARLPSKIAYANFETTLTRYLEPIQVLDPNSHYDSLSEAWKLLILNSAHDSICGTVTDRVHCDFLSRLAKARLSTLKVASKYFSNPKYPFNPSPWPRSTVFNGVYLESVDPLSTRYRQGNFPGIEVQESSLGTDKMYLDLLNGVFNLTCDGKVISSNMFELYWQADEGDEYNFAPGSDEVPVIKRYIKYWSSFKEPGIAKLNVSYSFGGPNNKSAKEHALWQITKIAGESFFRIKLTLHTNEINRRLRLYIPIGEPIDGTYSGTTFGSAYREYEPPGQRSGVEYDEKTVAARHFVAAGRLALVFNTPFEYEHVRKGNKDFVAVTLLRSVGKLSKPALTTRPGPAGPTISCPNAQCRGEITWEFGLTALDNPISLKKVWQYWEEFAHPIVGIATYLEPIGIFIRPGILILSSLRKVNGYTELRCFEPSGYKASIEDVTLPPGARRVDFLGNAIPHDNEIKPFEILTWSW